MRQKKPQKISLQKALIKILVHQYGFRRSDARVVYKGLIEALVQAILRGYAVELRGFGKIYPATRKPMRVNTVFTGGEDVLVPARRTIRFKPSAALREAVNGERSLIG